MLKILINMTITSFIILGSVVGITGLSSFLFLGSVPPIFSTIVGFALGVYLGIVFLRAGK